MNIKSIYIVGEINDELATEVSRQITEAKNADVDKIVFKINSGGGSVIAGLSIADEISALNCDTEAVIMGLCASSATYAALACDKVLMMKNGSFMIHRAHGSVQGTMEEMERDLEFLEEVENRFIAIYCAKTGLTQEEVIGMMDKTTYMNAQQALELKFIDEIVGKENTLFNVSDLELINSIEAEGPEKTFTQKIFDIFKSPETKEEETLKNQLDTAHEEIVRLTNELESIKVANEANVTELKNKLDELENERTALYNAIEEQKKNIETTIANEVNTRIAALGYDEEELAQPSNKLENTNIAEMVRKYGLDFALNYLNGNK